MFDAVRDVHGVPLMMPAKMPAGTPCHAFHEKDIDPETLQFHPCNYAADGDRLPLARAEGFTVTDEPAAEI